MLCKKRTILVLFLMVLIISISACGSKKEASKDRQLNIYVDIKDKDSQNVLKYIIDEYKKSNPKIKINANNAMGNNIEEDVSKGSEYDIVVTSRNNMIKLSRKGLLSDMGNFYEESKISEKYYRVMSAYGRFEDKYYGMATIPYTIELFYNKSALDKVGIKTPTTISDMREIMKKLNDTSIRVPVLIPEDLDINSGLSSILFSNRVSMRKLESKYDSGVNSYKSLTEMQQAFDDIGDLIKSGSISKNTFELGNESSISKFLKGDTPVLLSSSYYANSIKGDNIKILEESGNNTSSKLNVPVICDAIVCVPVNTKNGEEVTNFIKEIYNDDMQKKIQEKGFITGNKKANSNIKEGVKTSIVKHLENSTEDSVIFAYNIPEKLRSSISSKIDQMLSGKITKKEWEEAVDEAYK